MYGMRAPSMMFTGLHWLQYGRLRQVLPSCKFKEIRNLSQTSWSSPKILRQSDPTEIGSYFLRPSVDYFSSQPRPFKDDMKISKLILSLETVNEHFELFENIKNSASIVNRVSMLHRIAKITGRDGNQRRALEQEKDKSRQALNSTYLALLDSISKDIAKCQPRHLSNVMWALGKLAEKDHELVKVCERAILSHDITAFDYAGIYQIVRGCVNLELSAAEISSTLQESILDGHLKISYLNNKSLSTILRLFVKSEVCTAELFDILLEEVLSRDFLLMDTDALADFVWCFAKTKLKADTLFDRVEEEFLRKGTATLKTYHFLQILMAFTKAKKGGKQLFDILDNELALRGVQEFENYGLERIVWSFAKRYVRNAKVFNLVKEEVFNRGVGRFQVHGLVLLLYSFVLAQRQDNKLVEEIESELLSRDVDQIGNSNLCHVAWSLGRARKSDSKLFDVIEEGVLQRGLHQFSKSGKFRLLRGYTQAKRGTKQLYEGLQVSFLQDRLSDFTGGSIAELAWCFSEAESNAGPLINTGQLFDTLEREILTKGKLFFHARQLNRIKESFEKVGKGTKELFELCVVDN